METPSRIFFKEDQQFSQRWMWILLLISTVPLIIFMLYVMYRQLVLGEPVGSNHMPDGVLIWFGPLIIAMMVGMLVLLKMMKLSVQVDSRYLHIRYFPFFKRNIPLDDIVKWEARQYRPILEYGGWGIRFWFGGKAYNVSGNHGVQLELAGNKKLLIGSQHSEEFASAIQAAKSFNRKS
jgi:hypothetical protein